jgi:hypothetical protein
MLYMVTAEKIPGDERSRERFLIDATDDREAWHKASADCKRLGAMSIIVDVQMRPSCTGSKASASATKFARRDGKIGERTRFSDFHSALSVLILVIFAIIGCLAALAPAHAQQAGGMSDEIQKGHYLAVIMCSNCHVISPDQSIEPTLQPPAPSFESIAQRNSTSSEALGAFF